MSRISYLKVIVAMWEISQNYCDTDDILKTWRFLRKLWCVPIPAPLQRPIIVTLFQQVSVITKATVTGSTHSQKHTLTEEEEKSSVCAKYIHHMVELINRLLGNETIRLTTEHVWSGSCWRNSRSTLNLLLCVFFREVFLTITAALSLYFSDDAMVKRGVTESVLKEICEWNTCLHQRVKNIMITCGYN